MGRMDLKLIEEIKHATVGNYALGNSRFAGEVEQPLGRRASRTKARRPVVALDEYLWFVHEFSNVRRARCIGGLVWYRGSN